MDKVAEGCTFVAIFIVEGSFVFPIALLEGPFGHAKVVFVIFTHCGNTPF